MPVTPTSALLVGAAVGISGTSGAIMPGLTRLYLGAVTQAYIQGNGSNATVVNARDSVAVTAQAQEEVISVAAGVGGGTGFAVAGSLSVVGMDLQTQASIEGPVTILAGGNVLVGADDDTSIVNVGGSIAIGAGSAGIGAGVAVVVVDKQTTANIGGATVDALGNGSDTFPASRTRTGRPRAAPVPSTAWRSRRRLPRRSRTSRAVPAVPPAPASTARCRSRASTARPGHHHRRCPDQPEFHGASASQAVDVSATNQMDVYSFAGALAIGGAAGIGASVDVGTIHNNTIAVIGADTAVAASGAVSVNALDDWSFEGHAIGGGGGGTAGIAGSVHRLQCRQRRRQHLSDPTATATA